MRKPLQIMTNVFQLLPQVHHWQNLLWHPGPQRGTMHAKLRRPMDGLTDDRRQTSGISAAPLKVHRIASLENYT